MKVLAKLKITREAAEAYANENGIVLPESVFAEEEKVINVKTDDGKRGRPKKPVKVVISDESEDLFAGLVQNSIASSEDLDTTAAKEAVKAEKKAAEEAARAEKKAALEAEKLAKAEKLEAEKTEKAEKLEAEKLAKAEKKAAEETARAEKKAAEEAAKAEKKAALEAKKSEKPKKTSKADAKPEVGVAGGAEDEDEVTVTKFEFGGKKYLKSSTNVLYDAETQDEIGVWNEAKQEIEFAELEEEEEEE